MTARAQHRFQNCNSATPPGFADTVAVSNAAPNRDAATDSNFNSANPQVFADTAVASCPAQVPDAAVGYLTSQSMGDAITRHGRLAAVVDQEATAAFSFPESVRQLACRRVTAGDTGDIHPLASSPADLLQADPIPAIPFAKLQARHRFDQHFDPDGFLAAIEQKSQPQLLRTLFQLAGDKP